SKHNSEHGPGKRGRSARFDFALRIGGEVWTPYRSGNGWPREERPALTIDRYIDRRSIGQAEASEKVKVVAVTRRIYVDCSRRPKQALYVHHSGAAHSDPGPSYHSAHANRHLSQHQHPRDLGRVDVRRTQSGGR